MSRYPVCSEDLNAIQQHLNDDNEDPFDSIAPVTQNVELQDENEGNQDLHSDFNERYDLSDDIGIPSTSQNNEPLILNEMPDDQYRAMVQALNKKQNEFFYRALHFIKTTDNPFYSFVSGGGVGKSHLTKSIYQAALKYYNTVNTRPGEDFHHVKRLLLAPVPPSQSLKIRYAICTCVYVLVSIMKMKWGVPPSWHSDVQLISGIYI